MATRKWVLGLTAFAAAAPAAAMQDTRPATAPAGSADTRYCMRIEAVTGTRVERVRCWTRERWAEQGVDVDRDWADEGVRTIG
ncbi:hypothetical protein ACWPM1_11430 [Tsuneonella sp. HG249]